MYGTRPYDGSKKQERCLVNTNTTDRWVLAGIITGYIFMLCWLRLPTGHTVLRGMVTGASPMIIMIICVAFRYLFARGDHILVRFTDWMIRIGIGLIVVEAIAFWTIGIDISDPSPGARMGFMLYTMIPIAFSQGVIGLAVTYTVTTVVSWCLDRQPQA